MKLEVGCITLHTDAFDNMTFEEAEIVGMRLLELDYVKSTDSIHGIIEVELDCQKLEDVYPDILRHLSAPLAKGEHVEEVFHEWGEHPYSYKYHKGNFKI